MPDPFQDLSKASPEFIEQVVEALEKRAADPSMLPAINHYLGAIPWGEAENVLEIGAGTAPVARLIADRAPHARVVAQEPASALVEHAKRLSKEHSNLEIAVADGASTGLPNESQDVVVLQTVLSHVLDPFVIMQEAARVLKTGGWLAVCDVDFAKAGLASGANDPLDAMAKEFVRQFVTDPHVASKLTRLAVRAGLEICEFSVTNRVLVDNDNMRVWVEWPGRRMVDEGLIDQSLLDALLEEHDRRCDQGVLFGFQGIAILIARK